jgi:hypothetical protein
MDTADTTNLILAGVIGSLIVICVCFNVFNAFCRTYIEDTPLLSDTV